MDHYPCSGSIDLCPACRDDLRRLVACPDCQGGGGAPIHPEQPCPGCGWDVFSAMLMEEDVKSWPTRFGCPVCGCLLVDPAVCYHCGWRRP